MYIKSYLKKLRIKEIEIQANDGSAEVL